jgi:hypothetical protein
MSRVYRCVVRQEILVIVDERASNLHVERELLQAIDPNRPEDDRALNRVDPEALVRDAVQAEDVGNVIDIYAGASEVVTGFEELTP